MDGRPWADIRPLAIQVHLSCIAYLVTIIELQKQPHINVLTIKLKVQDKGCRVIPTQNNQTVIMTKP